jgi:hypothetical protein
MSLSLLIKREVYVDDQLTDADSVTLPAGVARADTGEVVVPAGTALTRVSTGVYQHTFTAVAGVTYTYTLVTTLGDDSYSKDDSITAPEETAAYLDVTGGDALASTFPAATLASYTAASSASKAAALLLASIDIDSMRYQGRKYDPDGTVTGTVQEREFPRISADHGRYAAGYEATGIGTYGQVWDWDTETSTAVVPDQVKLACLYQADSILKGDRDERLAAIHDGVAGQATGSQNESYRADAREARALCRRAWALMEKYRLEGGQLL